MIAREFGFGERRSEDQVGMQAMCSKAKIRRSEKAEAEMYIKVLKGVKLRPPAGNMSSNVGAGRPWG